VSSLEPPTLGLGCGGGRCGVGRWYLSGGMSTDTRSEVARYEVLLNSPIFISETDVPGQ
jgi:hypothetical protein